jgi:hypothetical protein
MNKRKLTTLVAAFICSLLLALSVVNVMASIELANGAPDIDWYVISSGGGVYNSTVPYELGGTIGQAVVGMSVDTDLELCSGFWCRLLVAYKNIYLPHITQNN